MKRFVAKQKAMALAKNLMVAGSIVGFTVGAHAAQLSNDAKSAIPKDVQQLIVVDYRAMQNSPAAMNLKDRVLQPELKRLGNLAENLRSKGGSGRGRTLLCGVPHGSGGRLRSHARDCSRPVSNSSNLGKLRQAKDKDCANSQQYGLSYGNERP